MKVRVNRAAFVRGFEVAKPHLEALNQPIGFLESNWRSGYLDLTLEQMLNSEMEVAKSIIITSVFQTENIEELNATTRENKIRILNILMDDYSLTLTDSRRGLAILINFIKNENIVLTREETDTLVESSRTLRRLNEVFNGRKTYFKIFKDALAYEIFSMNTSNVIVYNREYAISKGICPECGNQLLFSEDNHYDYRGQRRLYCNSSEHTCINSFRRATDLTTLGLEALDPIHDRQSLFAESSLIQSVIKISFLNNYNKMPVFLKELLNIFTYSYNKGELLEYNTDTHIIKLVTQPMGLKTTKKILERISSLVVMVNEEELKLIDYCEVKSQIVRLFNIDNIEEIYEEAVKEKAINFLTGKGLIFDLTTMTVIELPDEKTIDDAFGEIENGFVLKAEDCKLLNVLEKTLKEE